MHEGRLKTENMCQFIKLLFQYVPEHNTHGLSCCEIDPTYLKATALHETTVN